MASNYNQIPTGGTASGAQAVFDLDRLLMVFGLDGPDAVAALSKMKFALSRENPQTYMDSCMAIDERIERHIQSVNAAKQPMINFQDNHGSVVGSAKDCPVMNSPFSLGSAMSKKAALL